MAEKDFVPAIGHWVDNGALILDIARLGYLWRNDRVLDPTYGSGTFWKYWRPDKLTRVDLKPERSPDAPDGVDFRKLPFDTGSFDAVVFDPPYRLNGRPDPDFDDRWGTSEVTSWQDRMELIYAGIDECVRVARPGGRILIKCQDQVCSGQVRWQTIWCATRAQREGAWLVDMLHRMGGRPQPERKRKDGAPSPQVHARRNYSTMLVTEKVKS